MKRRPSQSAPSILLSPANAIQRKRCAELISNFVRGAATWQQRNGPTSKSRTKRLIFYLNCQNEIYFGPDTRKKRRNCFSRRGDQQKGGNSNIFRKFLVTDRRSMQYNNQQQAGPRWLRHGVATSTAMDPSHFVKLPVFFSGRRRGALFFFGKQHPHSVGQLCPFFDLRACFFPLQIKTGLFFRCLKMRKCCHALKRLTKKKWTSPFFEARRSYARKIIINGGISIGTLGALCRLLAVLSTEYCIKESCFPWDNCHLLSIRQSDELMKSWQSS